MDRRRFILGGAAALGAAALGGGPARAIGSGQLFRVVRIRHGGGSDVHPGAGSLLAEELRFRTSVDVEDGETSMALDDPRLSRTPFAILAGDSAFTLREAERERLKRWVELGGFLLVDTGGGAGGAAEGFERAVKRELAALFPGDEPKRVSPEHVLFRSFYRLDYPAGRALRRPYVEGLLLGSRYGVVLMPNDLLGAFARDPAGNRFLHVPEPGGENQREMAIRFGVNVVMYALCLHYKDDQVHLDYLLHNRKWKIRKPVE